MFAELGKGLTPFGHGPKYISGSQPHPGGGGTAEGMRSKEKQLLLKLDISQEVFFSMSLCFSQGLP